MEYTVDFEETSGFTLVTVRGRREVGHELEDAKVYWAKIALYCREHQPKRVLVSVELTGEIPKIVSYQLGLEAEALGFKPNLKLAIVDPNEQARKSHELGALTASNRGYDIEVFASQEEAKNWLTDEGPERT